MDQILQIFLARNLQAHTYLTIFRPQKIALMICLICYHHLCTEPPKLAKVVGTGSANLTVGSLLQIPCGVEIDDEYGSEELTELRESFEFHWFKGLLAFFVFSHSFRSIFIRWKSVVI